MIERFLRDASLKNTKQRCSILNIIESSKSPVTAEEIYKILTEKKEDINLSTVYRTLNTLSEKNVILKVLREDGTASYQMNDMLHNHYITCRICHRSVLIAECPIDDLSRKVSRDTGFKVTGHSLQLTGICPECQEK